MGMWFTSSTGGYGEERVNPRRPLCTPLALPLAAGQYSHRFNSPVHTLGSRCGTHRMWRQRGGGWRGNGKVWGWVGGGKSEERGMCECPSILCPPASAVAAGVGGSLAIPEVPSSLLLRTRSDILWGVAGERCRGGVNVSWRGRILAATPTHTLISTLPDEHSVLHMA